MNEYDTTEAEQMWAAIRRTLPNDEATKFAAAKPLLGVIERLARVANYATKLSDVDDDTEVVALDVYVSQRQNAWIRASDDGTISVGTIAYPPEHEEAPLDFDYTAGVFVGKVDPETKERRSAVAVLTALVQKYLLRAKA